MYLQKQLKNVKSGILQTPRQNFKSLSQKFIYTEIYKQHYIEEEHTLLKMFRGRRKVHVLCMSYTTDSNES